MKKGMIAFMFFVLALALIVVTGCGDQTTVQTTGGSGTVETENGGGKITINEGEESATLEQTGEAPSEAELGVPIYPGATYNAENSGSADYSSEGGTAGGITAEFLTSDSFSQVVGWYQGKLGAPIASGSDSAEWMVGDITTGNYSAVSVEKSGNMVRIRIVRMTTSIN